MIRVHCYTNLDDFQKEHWPTFMCCRPQIGDCVRSKSGVGLMIVRITHEIDKTSGDPMLFIELHK